MLKLAVRNLLRHGFRSTLTLAAIALGVAGLVIAGGFVQDVYVKLAEATIHSQLGHLQVFRVGYYERGARKPLQFPIESPQKLLATIKQNPKVDTAMLRLRYSALLGNGRKDYAVDVEGIEPALEARLGSQVGVLRGRRLETNDHNAAILGEGVARELGIRVGDSAVLLGSSAEGSVNDLDVNVVGVFRTFSKDYDNRTVRVPLADAQHLVDADVANAAVVLLHHTADTEEARRELERALAGFDVEIKTWNELSDFYAKTVELYRRQFGVLQIIVAAMVVLSVSNSVSITTFERMGEFGTMRALGDTAKDIRKLLLIEGLVAGVVGSTVGVLIGALTAIIVSTVGIPMPPPPNAESGYTAAILIIPQQVVIAWLIGFGATVLSSIAPAGVVAKTPLAEALRRNV